MKKIDPDLIDRCAAFLENYAAYQERAMGDSSFTDSQRKSIRIHAASVREDAEALRALVDTKSKRAVTEQDRLDLIDHAKELIAMNWPLARHRHDMSTALLAAEKARPWARTTRVRVFTFLLQRQDRGVINEDICLAIGERQNNVSTTLTALRDEFGVIENTGESKKNSRGNPEAVWQVKGEFLPSTQRQLI